MSHILVRDGDLFEKDPSDVAVITFDWDTENLAIGASIAGSVFKIAPAGSLGSAIRKTVASLTRSGTTATVTTEDPHDYATNDSVTIAGAAAAVGVISPYNGTFTVTVTGPTTFTYAVTGTPASPATGTIVAASGLDNASVPNTDKTLDDGTVLHSNRYTQIRLSGGVEGAKYDLTNTILTSENPAQIKERSVRVSIQQQ